MHMSFRQMVSESKVGKLMHLTHLEDMVLEGGINGTRDAINFLRAIRDMLAGHTKPHIHLTVKFDGAPSITTGVNPENGKFFVATKGAFSVKPKLNYTDEDIDRNHPSPGLNHKLRMALYYFKDLGITNIIQGDLMFTRDDIKHQLIEGVPYITFQPNTIVYAIPEESKLAQIILASHIGIVFHTTYVGDTIADMKATPGVNIGKLKHTKDVWFRDATFTDASGTATFTEQETAAITAILSEAGYLFQKLSPAVVNRIAETETIRIQIMTYNNSKVRAGEEITNTGHHVAGLIDWVTNKINHEIISAKKADTREKRELQKRELLMFYQPNIYQLKLIFDLQNIIVRAKAMILAKLNSVRDIGTFYRTPEGLKVANQEGFVAVDHFTGNMIKLVDRLEFSHHNFVAAKEWTK